jgi:hypothetical protein
VSVFTRPICNTFCWKTLEKPLSIKTIILIIKVINKISDHRVFISSSYNVTLVMVGDDKNDNRPRTNTTIAPSIAYVHVDVFAQRIALLKNVANKYA